MIYVADMRPFHHKYKVLITFVTTYAATVNDRHSRNQHGVHHQTQKYLLQRSTFSISMIKLDFMKSLLHKIYICISVGRI